MALRARCTLAEALGERLDRWAGALLADFTTRLGDVLDAIAAGTPGNRELAALRRDADTPASPGSDVIDRLLGEEENR